MRYKADITAGSLKVTESRIVAELLLKKVSPDEWRKKIIEENILQARSEATAIRLGRLIRKRLEIMQPELWKLVRDGAGEVATHAVLAAAVKHSRLLGDFLDLVVKEQYRIYNLVLSNKLWDEYIADCQRRDPDIASWQEGTRKRLRSSVFQVLAQAGYIENTRSKILQNVHIASQVLDYLEKNNEEYVLRCIQVTP
jgi:hypothetical protein